MFPKPTLTPRFTSLRAREVCISIQTDPVALRSVDADKDGFMRREELFKMGKMGNQIVARHAFAAKGNGAERAHSPG